MIAQPEITPVFLRQLMAYEPLTGRLFWKERDRSLFTLDREYLRWNRRYGGKEACYDRGTGYRGAFVFRRSFSAHRLAWAIHHGEWPTGDIDHINGVRDDNRIANLRIVSRSENCRNTKRRANNTSGQMGVARHKSKYRAFITLHLGIFETFEEAVSARKEAEQQLGYHKNHGRAA